MRPSWEAKTSHGETCAFAREQAAEPKGRLRLAPFRAEMREAGLSPQPPWRGELKPDLEGWGEVEPGRGSRNRRFRLGSWDHVDKGGNDPIWAGSSGEVEGRKDSGAQAPRPRAPPAPAPGVVVRVWDGLAEGVSRAKSWRPFNEPPSF